MDVTSHNRDAWDRNVRAGDRWTIPVKGAQIAAARRGEWSIVLTPIKPVPRAWFPDLRDLPVLALASGGGQQGPILAAAGARVTVFDNSPAQLAQDRLVAEREGLTIATVRGDMADLSSFRDETFDLIVHPCANCFVPDVRPVYREAFRVLRRGGALLSGFCDPVIFAIDPVLEKQGIAQLGRTVPYSDVTSLPEEERRRLIDSGEPLAFGHTLEDQIGGQTAAGFLIAGFYDDVHVDPDVASKYMPCFHATRAIKPG
jgi:SAM-dependent methyltransferase